MATDLSIDPDLFDRALAVAWHCALKLRTSPA
jgi:hypothetical protein